LQITVYVIDNNSKDDTAENPCEGCRNAALQSEYRLEIRQGLSGEKRRYPLKRDGDLVGFISR